MLSRPTFWLEQQLAADWPPEIWSSTTVIVAVSGGADSVAMLRALCSLKTPSNGRLIVAHFNHGVRGEEAEGDARFVQRLCEELGVACEVGRVEAIPGVGEYSSSGGEGQTRPDGEPRPREGGDEAGVPRQEVGSTRQEVGSTRQEVGSTRQDAASTWQDAASTWQDAASAWQEVGGSREEVASALRSEAAFRRARYAFLAQVAGRYGARYVATGHTADDQAETVLHRLFRGTGIAGLAGIGRFRPLLYGVVLVRPLLWVRRRDVLKYLQAKDQPYREDSTNRGQRFTRNRLRHAMIPRIESEYNRQFVPAMSRLAALAAEVQSLIGDLMTPLLAHVQIQDSLRVTIACAPLQSVRPLVIRELLVEVWRQQGWPEQAMSYAKWQQLCRLVQAADAAAAETSAMLPGGIIARREADHLTLERRL